MAVLPQSSVAVQVRTWTTADGGKTIQAEFVKSSDGKVTIRRSKDRKVFTIPLATLSEADQEWVKAELVRMEDEEAAKNGKVASEEFGKLLTGDWERTEGHGLKYRIFGERKMKKSKDAGYPLVVWLHGRGGDVMTPDPDLAPDWVTGLTLIDPQTLSAPAALSSAAQARGGVAVSERYSLSAWCGSCSKYDGANQ